MPASSSACTSSALGPVDLSASSAISMIPRENEKISTGQETIEVGIFDRLERSPFYPMKSEHINRMKIYIAVPKTDSVSQQSNPLSQLLPIVKQTLLLRSAWDQDSNCPYNATNTLGDAARTAWQVQNPPALFPAGGYYHSESQYAQYKSARAMEPALGIALSKAEDKDFFSIKIHPTEESFISAKRNARQSDTCDVQSHQLDIIVELVSGTEEWQRYASGLGLSVSGDGRSIRIDDPVKALDWSIKADGSLIYPITNHDQGCWTKWT